MKKFIKKKKQRAMFVCYKIIMNILEVNVHVPNTTSTNIVMRRKSVSVIIVCVDVVHLFKGFFKLNFT